MKNGSFSQSLGITDVGGMKYLHKSDDQFDYLIDLSENEVKINLKFTKDLEKRNDAKNALKTFFLELF